MPDHEAGCQGRSCRVALPPQVGQTAPKGAQEEEGLSASPRPDAERREPQGSRVPRTTYQHVPRTESGSEQKKERPSTAWQHSRAWRSAAATRRTAPRAGHLAPATGRPGGWRTWGGRRGRPRQARPTDDVDWSTDGGRAVAPMAEGNRTPAPHPKRPTMSRRCAERRERKGGRPAGSMDAALGSPPPTAAAAAASSHL